MYVSLANIGLSEAFNLKIDATTLSFRVKDPVKYQIPSQRIYPYFPEEQGAPPNSLLL